MVISFRAKRKTVRTCEEKWSAGGGTRRFPDCKSSHERKSNFPPKSDLNSLFTAFCSNETKENRSVRASHKSRLSGCGTSGWSLPPVQIQSSAVLIQHFLLVIVKKKRDWQWPFKKTNQNILLQPITKLLYSEILIWNWLREFVETYLPYFTQKLLRTLNRFKWRKIKWEKVEISSDELRICALNQTN